MMNTKVNRGDIYYCNLNPAKGSVQGGIRPVVVIQNQVGNRHSPTIIVAVVTTIIKKTRQPTHILLNEKCGLPKNSMLMLEQIKTIDKCELLGFIGRITEPNTLIALNRAIGVSLGLDGRSDL